MRVSFSLVAGVTLGAAAALLHERGTFAARERQVDDLLWRAAAALETPRDNDLLCYRVTPRDPAAGFASNEVLASLRNLAKIPNATVLLGLPPSGTAGDTAAADVAELLYPLGRALVAVEDGDFEPPEKGRLERFGRGITDGDLGPAPTTEAVSALIERAASRIVAVGHRGSETSLRDYEDGDGVLRSFPVARGEGARVCPSPPVAIAASNLRESSLLFSADLRTIERFGGVDLRLAGANRLRVRFHEARVFLPSELPDLGELDIDKKRPPILLVAFAGSSLLDLVSTPLGDQRTLLEAIADAVDDLLADAVIHAPPRALELSLIVLLPAALGLLLHAVRRRPFATIVLATLSLAACAAVAFVLALELGLALPMVAIGAAMLLTALAAAGAAAESQR